MMFTSDQIKAAHSKVNSGADFPRYIQDLIAIGVNRYDTFVVDGHSEYYGENGQLTSPPKYDSLSIGNQSRPEQFIERLKLHQQGKTDYKGFCNDAAANGIEKWTVDTLAMTCTYYSKNGNAVLCEDIPRK